MENAQLISLSRQIALQRQMDVVANNMANINTSGFKAENMLFQQYDMPVAADNDFAGSQTVAYTQDWATVHDMSNGPLARAGGPRGGGRGGGGGRAGAAAAGARGARAGARAGDRAG